MTNPMQAQLDAAAAATQAPAEAVQQAQPIQATASAVVASVPATHVPATATALTMDSAEVVAQNSVSSFIKLIDGGLKLEDAKFGAVEFEIVIAGAESGGSFRPCKMMNYQGANGYVYTKSYDGVNTSSSDASHNGLPWHSNVEKILAKSPKAFEFLGYELALKVHKDVTSNDGKVEIAAGTVFGYSTPYTSSKQIKALWDKYSGTNRGDSVVVSISGLEVNKNGFEYNKLIIEPVKVIEAD